uniref:Homing endonuclease LAGLIDADG domain-containing protein n=1 Tax=Chrysoporthe deuterocubensis TaxID=764597 RepID=A0A191MWV8_9PEZI|nr:hypothetical protein [Chrysoporthe deuterocubensis]AMX22155.1 hypothetical protein [Chrysoporthe deuterocubensis]
MNEIHNFLENLSGTNGLYSDAFKVTILKTLKFNLNTAYRIKISDISYFWVALIPLLLSLQWVSKKKIRFLRLTFNLFIKRKRSSLRRSRQVSPAAPKMGKH